MFPVAFCYNLKENTVSRWIIPLIILLVVAAVLVVLYFLGRRAQKKADEQELKMEEAAQKISLLVIDKKKMRLKDAGFPQVVMDNANFMAKRAKVPVIKAKVGLKIMTLMCDPKIFDGIPLKKECKVMASGIYISKIISIRGGQVPEPEKKGFFKRVFNR